MKSLEKYRIDARPEANEAAIIVGEKYRITVLTTALIRFEYSESGKFEDRPTQKVYNRDFPVPQFQVRDDGEELHIYTKDMEVHYNKEKFNPRGLMIRVAGGKAGERVWHYGEEPKDLYGTARTLDWADGAIPLEHGLMSKDGFSVMDDTGSMAILENGQVEPRTRENIDFYFWAYGHRYLECLQDFYHLCGKTPLLPRYVFGNWWSRYHKYTEEEYRELIERFDREQIPFSVAVIDMDWHLVEEVDPVYGSGWTGYTWNRKLFPEPPKFLDWLHEHHLKVTLNVHPADGIRAYEDAYPAVAEEMGMNPEDKEPVLFDMTNPDFIRTYFEVLHHPMEKEGVDFWWIDWQQGTVTKVEGLDPLWMLNHYHYLDSKWKGTRPLTFSRYAGPGSHRYPIGFSGDTIITWDSLAFQPYFTANASNIGYGWWSHDIGGHMFGTRDDELTARWVQLGVFSPINRLHSTENPFNGKEPWKYNKITEGIMKEFLRLRNRLVPYLYTMNRYASRDGQPLIQPMYYKEPEVEETYQVPNNYYFGTELMVSPITEKADDKALMARAKTWIPEGTWYDFFSGRKYQGGRMANLWRPLEEMPVLARSGAIVPLKDMEEYDNSVENPGRLEVQVFPGTSGRFVLWEDQGDTPEDLDENWASTELVLENQEGAARFLVKAAAGNLSVLPEKRSWKLVFNNVKKTAVKVFLQGEELPCSVSYVHGHQLIVGTGLIPVGEELEVLFEGGLQEAEDRIEEDLYRLLERAQISYDLKAELLQTIQRLGRGAVPSVLAKELPKALEGAILELLTA